MIVFDKVSKQFFNHSFGVKEISFEVETGELVLITGPTGSGKTTIMRLLTKEYEPTAGEIIFNGTSLTTIKHLKIPLHRRQIGVVFQDYRLLPESNVWENMALPLMIAARPKEQIEKRVTDLLKLVKLENKADLFPRELSGGEAQRVSIARALATAPTTLFADEPTGNLDQATSLEIIKLLKKVNELGTTVFISTHDLVVLRKLKGTRRLELSNGELVADNDPKKKESENSNHNKKKVKKKKSNKNQADESSSNSNKEKK